MGGTARGIVFDGNSGSGYVLPCSAESLRLPEIQYRDGKVPLATLRACHIKTGVIDQQNGEFRLSDVLQYLDDVACQSQRIGVERTIVKRAPSEAKATISSC